MSECVTVLAAGVFDILHPGHIYFLEKARELGDELVVIVARDETTERKKRRPVIPEAQRLEVVKALKPVDKAILGDLNDIFRLLPEIQPDIIALGFDQEVDEIWLSKELLSRGLEAKVVRIEDRLKGEFVSTRKIIDMIKRARNG